MPKRQISGSVNFLEFSKYEPYVLHGYIFKPFRLEEKYVGSKRLVKYNLIIENGDQIVIQVRSSAGLN